MRTAPSVEHTQALLKTILNIGGYPTNLIARLLYGCGLRVSEPLNLRRSRLDLVVCFKLDRLGRSLAHLAQIIAELTAHKVALICTSQGIDTSNDNPAGRLQLGVLMAVAEFERSIIQERVSAGLKAAKARGVRLGRPESLSKHQKAVHDLVSQGKSLRTVAKELGLPVSSVFKLARNGNGKS